MHSRSVRLLRVVLAPAALLSLVLALLVLALPGVAHADGTATCIATNENSQKLRREKKLKEALEELKICSQPTCPTAVQKDCTQWMREVEAALPSVSFSAKDGAGNDLTDVRVDMDDQLLLQQLDGSSVPIDPGKHTFKFSHEGAPDSTQEILVSEGDKARKIEVRFKTGGAAVTDPAAGPHYTPFPFVLAGVGVVGLITGTALFVVGKSAFPDACKGDNLPKDARTGLDACGTIDEAHDANVAITKSNVGTGFLIGGGVALAGGITWFLVETFSAGDKPSDAARRHTKPRILPTLGLTSVGVQGTF